MLVKTTFVIMTFPPNVNHIWSQQNSLFVCCFFFFLERRHSQSFNKYLLSFRKHPRYLKPSIIESIFIPNKDAISSTSRSSTTTSIRSIFVFVYVEPNRFTEIHEDPMKSDPLREYCFTSTQCVINKHQLRNFSSFGYYASIYQCFLKPCLNSPVEGIHAQNEKKQR